MRRDGLFRQKAKQQLDELIHAGLAFTARHRGALPAYERLLCHVRSRTNLLHPCDRAGDNRSIVNVGLIDLALHHADWIRSIEMWHPVNLSVWPLFSSLAQHLLARYPVPAFMTSVWFEQSLGKRLPQQEWYKHLGRGENIRTAKLPLRLTKAMAHWFTQRQVTIWSMQVETQRGQHRVLTIEVDMPTRTIWQIRGKCNRWPNAGELAIIERWAAVEGLKIGEAA